MNTISRWSGNKTILLRGVSRQIIWFAMPVVVVRDSPELIALYWRAGTPNKIPEKRLTPMELLTNQKVNLMDRTWEETDVLMLVTPGASHAVYAMWESGHSRFRCWYVDLQDPLRRTSLGFDTMDHLLDIVISPDRAKWRWKDEDEFREAVEIGLYSMEKASAIRAEGKRVIKLLETNQSPFFDGWERWSPPSEWQRPVFPDDWDRMDVRSS